MAVEDSTDLAAFYSTDEFAIPATYSPEQFASVHPSSKSRTVNGIFDKEYVEINGVSAYMPVFECVEADVSDISNGAKLTVNSVIYTVRHYEPDGTGTIKLILEAPNG